MGQDWSLLASCWVSHVLYLGHALFLYKMNQHLADVPGLPQEFWQDVNCVGSCTGSMFIWSIQKWLDQFEDVKFETLRGASARKVLLVVGIMAAHALGEGSGVGVSFCGQRGWSQVFSLPIC